jgi:hypothetical protein
MHLKHPALGALVCALLLCAAPAAFAQTAAQNGYSAPAGNVQEQLGGARDAPRAHAAAADDQGGSLPFSGLDLGLVAAAGAVLLGFGFAVRRLSNSVMS